MKYFALTTLGRSSWWSWIIGTWIAMIIWILAQTVLMGIVGSVTEVLDPDLADRIARAESAMIPEENIGSFAIYLLFSLLAALASIGFSIATIISSNKDLTKAPNISAFGGDVHPASDKSNTQVLAILAVISIFVSIITYMTASSSLDDSEVMTNLMSAMGLSPITYGLFLLTFPAGCLGLFFVQKIVHQRPITSLFTAAKSINWARILEGFIITVLILGGFTLIGSKLGLFEVRNIFDSSVFWGFAITSLLLIPLQSGTEEIVFRGYFNQGLMHFVNNKWVVFIITSVAFMALHLSNPEAIEGAKAGNLPIVMSGYFFFGFAMCLLVWFDDGLETAIGVHAGNNCFAAIFVNYEGSVLPTPSAYIVTPDATKDSISTIIVLAIIVAFFWWRRGAPSPSNGKPSTGAA